MPVVFAYVLAVFRIIFPFTIDFKGSLQKRQIDGKMHATKTTYILASFPTACISDLDKFNMFECFDFRLNLFFATASAASKNKT